MGNFSCYKKFSVDQISSQDGKIFLITGANSGIGYEIAKQLVLKGAMVIVAGRNRQKIDDAVNRLSEIASTTELSKLSIIHSAIVDLASLHSITEFADDMSRRFDHVDVLIDNAGVFGPPHSKTAEGFDITLGTNTIGTAYLTNLLLRLILRSERGRIIILSSNTVNVTSTKVFDSFINDVGGERVNDTTLHMYGLSKLLITFYAQELQKRLIEKRYNTAVIAVHPGFVATEIQSKVNKDLVIFTAVDVLTHAEAVKPEIGALSSLYAATAPEAVRYKGRTLDDGPNVKLLKFTTFAYNDVNSDMAFHAINDVILTKGFQGFKL